MYSRKIISFIFIVLIVFSTVHSANGQRRSLQRNKIVRLIESFYKLYTKIRDLFTEARKKITSHAKSAVHKISHIMKIDPSKNENTAPVTDSNDSEKDTPSTEAYDCFGMGNEFSTGVETWLQGNTSSDSNVKVKLFIKTRRNPRRVDITDGNPFLLDRADFHIERQTFFIVHGYFTSSEAEWIIELENGLLQRDDVNVISADWSDQYFSVNYFRSARSTQTVGNQIVTFFNKLRSFEVHRKGYRVESWGRIHLIGHSLGAHICAYTAHEIKRRNMDWMVHRITGLDPAKICFESSDPVLKLDSEDAPFVDVIHTNSERSRIQGLSLYNPLGHFDFYPNGGKHQPGCSGSNILLPDSIKLPRQMLHEAVCSHGKAYLYFVESVVNSVARNCTFWAKPWDMSEESAKKMLWDSCSVQTCVEMGINSESYFHGNKGTFFVLTSGSAPYCRIKRNEEVTAVKEILEEDKQESSLFNFFNLFHKK